MGEVLCVRGGKPLQGVVQIPTAKNSILPLLAAGILCEGPVTLEAVPDLADVQASVQLLRGLGMDVQRQAGRITLQSSGTLTGQVPEGPARAMRSSVFYLAPLLHRVGWVSMPLPGGCDLGPRPIDIHLDGLVHMGARVHWKQTLLTLRAPGGLHGTDYCLRLPSVGATATLLMAASRAKGTTVLRGVACEPEIQDLASFLRRCGARISGDGTPVIVVHGVKELHGGTYRPMPDRIVAATVAAAAASAGGSVTARDCCPAHLLPVLEVLRLAGCTVSLGSDCLTVTRTAPLRAVERVCAGVYPGFPTDASPLVAAALLTAAGSTALHDGVFAHRFACAEGFAAMGANVQCTGHTLRITGVHQLHGARTKAPDLRGGAALVLAALAAQGESRISDPGHIHRGYEDFAALLRSLGADVQTITE